MRRTILLFVMALTAAGCGGGDEDGAGGTTTSTPATTVATESCLAEADGYRVEYPADWSTNETDRAEPCRFFHPERFELDPGSEATDIAIVLRFTSADFERLTTDVLEDPAGAEILEAETLTVGGQEALRVEAESTGEAQLPEGTRSVQYFVDFDSRTMTATTLSLAADVSFDESTAVLDRMMDSLERITSPVQPS